MLYYYIQNDRGESSATPNACKLNPSQPNKIILQDIYNALQTLMITSSFHFRFQMIMEKQPVFLDLLNPQDVVPLINGNVIAKLLRLDNIRCVSRLINNGLVLKSYVPSQTPWNNTNTNDNNNSSSSSSTNPTSPRSTVPVPLPFQMPVMDTAKVLHVVPKEEDGETHIKDTGEGDNIYKNLKATDARGMRPVKIIQEDTKPVEVPDNVDEDLADKSDYVKAKIMARREEVKAAAAARVAEMEASIASEAKETQEREAAKLLYEAKLKDWALEPGGKVKSIRLLISTLHTVLWETAKWEPVPMAKLVIPNKVKAFFLRAITQVHPDKHNTLDGSQKYIATQIFHYLESSYREFQDTELNN